MSYFHRTLVMKAERSHTYKSWSDFEASRLAESIPAHIGASNYHSLRSLETADATLKAQHVSAAAAHEKASKSENKDDSAAARKLSEAFMPTMKKDFSTEERKDLAKEGKAMPDGSYPITNGADLEHAIELSGMGSGSKDAIKAHIKARAKDLGLSDKIPAAWATKSEGFDRIFKNVSPFNPAESDPKNTDTMEEDPAVNSLQEPKPYLAFLGASQKRSPFKKANGKGKPNGFQNVPDDAAAIQAQFQT